MSWGLFAGFQTVKSSQRCLADTLGGTTEGGGVGFGARTGICDLAVLREPVWTRIVAKWRLTGHKMNNQPAEHSPRRKGQKEVAKGNQIKPDLIFPRLLVYSKCFFCTIPNQHVCCGPAVQSFWHLFIGLCGLSRAVMTCGSVRKPAG